MKKIFIVFFFAFILFSCNSKNIQNQDNNTQNFQNSGSISIETEIKTQKENDSNVDILTLGDFSLTYDKDFLEFGKVPEIFTGACEDNSLKSLSGIISDLSGYDLTDIETQEKSLNGNNYLTFKLNDAGAGNVYNSYFYSTKLDNNCLVVEIQTHLTNCENYLPLEDGNTKQKESYDKCIKETDEEPVYIKQIENSFKISN